jgi:hypothetical protein
LDKRMWGEIASLSTLPAFHGLADDVRTVFNDRTFFNVSVATLAVRYTSQMIHTLQLLSCTLPLLQWAQLLLSCIPPLPVIPSL